MQQSQITLTEIHKSNYKPLTNWPKRLYDTYIIYIPSAVVITVKWQLHSCGNIS